jgi:hypothetical protein
MTETEQTKVCPLCAETIKAAAKVCPFCRKIQKRGFFISRWDILAIATMLLFLGIIILLFNLFSSGRNFSSSKDKLLVLNSQLGIESSLDTTNVVVSGVLTNASDYAWNVGEFEIRFFDESGKIIDMDSGSGGFTVLSHSDHSFNLALFSRKSIPKHASFNVLVRSANDPSDWFGSD